MAVFDHNGNLVGVVPHVRDVGPHAHAWVQVGTVGAETYSECSLCGARTTNVPAAAFSSRRDWLAGGDWEKPSDLAAATPEDVTAAIDELNEAQRHPSDEHKAAMPSVTVLSDPIREQNEQAAENQRKLDADVHAAAAEADAQGARAGAAKPRDKADAASPPPAEQAESAADEDEVDEARPTATRPGAAAARASRPSRPVSAAKAPFR
jgi:hypothetical protein